MLHHNGGESVTNILYYEYLRSLKWRLSMENMQMNVILILGLYIVLRDGTC